MTVLTLVAGAAAFGDLADSAPTIILQIGAAFITAISIVQITTSVSEASFQHREWMKNWVNLGLKVKHTTTPTKEDVDLWESDIATTESECVSEFRALRILCEDESARYFNIPHRQHRIWLLQRVFANFGTFQAAIPLVEIENLPVGVIPPTP